MVTPSVVVTVHTLFIPHDPPQRSHTENFHTDPASCISMLWVQDLLNLHEMWSGSARKWPTCSEWQELVDKCLRFLSSQRKYFQGVFYTVCQKLPSRIEPLLTAVTCSSIYPLLVSPFFILLSSLLHWASCKIFHNEIIAPKSSSESLSTKCLSLGLLRL